MPLRPAASFCTPITRSQNRKSRQAGYALCRHYLNHEFDREEILQAGRRMLAAHLTGWFGLRL
jgi:hypothetical protein